MALDDPSPAFGFASKQIERELSGHGPDTPPDIDTVRDALYQLEVVLRDEENARPFLEARLGGLTVHGQREPFGRVEAVGDWLLLNMDEATPSDLENIATWLDSAASVLADIAAGDAPVKSGLSELFHTGSKVFEIAVAAAGADGLALKASTVVAALESLDDAEESLDRARGAVDKLWEASLAEYQERTHAAIDAARGPSGRRITPLTQRRGGISLRNFRRKGALPATAFFDPLQSVSKWAADGAKLVSIRKRVREEAAAREDLWRAPMTGLVQRVNKRDMSRDASNLMEVALSGIAGGVSSFRKATEELVGVGVEVTAPSSQLVSRLLSEADGRDVAGVSSVQDIYRAATAISEAAGAVRASLQSLAPEVAFGRATGRATLEQ